MASYFNFPCNVLLFAPLYRWIRGAGDAIIFRATPLMPIVSDRLGLASRSHQNRNGKEENSGANLHNNIFRGGNNLSKFHILEFVIS